MLGKTRLLVQGIYMKLVRITDREIEKFMNSDDRDKLILSRLNNYCRGK